jgi:hypothetical protein
MKKRTFQKISLVTVAFTVFIACSKDSAGVKTPTGKNGSVTRFTISGNYLYAVSSHFFMLMT